MDEEEEDMYAPDEGVGGVENGGSGHYQAGNAYASNPQANAEEEGEEIEEDDSDSDIDIIVERKDNIKPEPPKPQRVNAIKIEPSRTSTPPSQSKRQASPSIKADPSRASPKADTSRPGSSYPATKTSKIDIDAKPVYEANGKPILEIDMDADFPEDDKPWRRPGTDITDYFNYGFDEFTWASYCLKQDSLRKEVSDTKKQMEDMQSFLGMPGGVPGPALPGVPGAAGAQPGMTAPGGPGDMPPEMQQMMQQMMQQGMDPTQMDFTTFAQMLGGTQGAMSGGQGFPQQGQTQQSQMGYGYGSGGGNQGANTNNRNQGGRGQGRRNW